MVSEVKVFAHRGASGEAFENTFKAFNKAIKQKADGIEVDLQCSKDGHLFVFHDLNLLRLVGINRFFYDCTYEELKNFPLGRTFLRRFSNLRIPPIEEFMEWVQLNPIPINIELKESLLKHPDELITWLIDLELPLGSHFSSFYDELLQIVKQVRPEFETAIIVTKLFNWDALESLHHIDAIHANKKYYKHRYLTTASAAKKHMRFYGIEGKEPFLKNPHPIVKGWITDYPLKLVKFLGRK